MRKDLSQDVRRVFGETAAQKNTLKALPAPEGSRPLNKMNRDWGGSLGNVLGITYIVTNYNGDEAQADKIEKSVATSSPNGLIYGVTSIPDNNTPGWSHSIMRLKEKLGTRTELFGKQIKNKNHIDSGVLRTEPNKHGLSTFALLGAAMSAVLEKRGEVMKKWHDPNDKRRMAQKIGNFVLMSDELVAETVGSTPEEVSGGSVHQLVGWNAEHGTMEWRLITPGMTDDQQESEPDTITDLD